MSIGTVYNNDEGRLRLFIGVTVGSIAWLMRNGCRVYIYLGAQQLKLPPNNEKPPQRLLVVSCGF